MGRQGPVLARPQTPWGRYPLLSSMSLPHQWARLPGGTILWEVGAGERRVEAWWPAQGFGGDTKHRDGHGGTRKIQTRGAQDRRVGPGEEVSGPGTADARNIRKSKSPWMRSASTRPRARPRASEGRLDPDSAAPSSGQPTEVTDGRGMLRLRV